MSGETWTEYGVRWKCDHDGCTVVEEVEKHATREHAEKVAAFYRHATLVGRTVTASDWLPVQDQLPPPAGYVSPLPLHRTEANYGVVCGTCDGGGCLDCTDPA